MHITNHEGSLVFRKHLRNRPQHIPLPYIRYTFPSTSPFIHVPNQCQLLSTVSILLQKNSSFHLTTNGINNALSHTRLTIREDSPPHPLTGKVTLQLSPSLCYDIPALCTQPNQLIYQLKSCESYIRFHSSQRHIHDDMNQAKRSVTNSKCGEMINAFTDLVSPLQWRKPLENYSTRALKKSTVMSRTLF